MTDSEDTFARMNRLEAFAREHGSGPIRPYVQLRGLTDNTGFLEVGFRVPIDDVALVAPRLEELGREVGEVLPTSIDELDEN